MILLALTLFIGLSACGNDDKELPDEPGKEQGGNGGDEPENPDNSSGNEPVSWYVATTGNDGNSGTLDSPLKSISKALLRVNPGDTIFLREGAYHAFVPPTRPGAKGKLITSKSYQRDTANVCSVHWFILKVSNILLLKTCISAMLRIRMLIPTRKEYISMECQETSLSVTVRFII